eukprot:1161847-Pelagomonas_calceolata.AAC.1
MNVPECNVRAHWPRPDWTWCRCKSQALISTSPGFALSSAGFFQDPGVEVTKLLADREYYLKALWLTVAPAHEDYVPMLGIEASENALTAGQWHPAMGYADAYFGTTADYNAEFEQAFGSQPSYVAAGATATSYSLAVAIQEAFQLCSFPESDFSANELLYDESIVKCEDQLGRPLPGNGYDSIRNSLSRQQLTTFFGEVCAWRSVCKGTVMVSACASIGVLTDLCVLVQALRPFFPCARIGVLTDLCVLVQALRHFFHCARIGVLTDLCVLVQALRHFFHCARIGVLTDLCVLVQALRHFFLDGCLCFVLAFMSRKSVTSRGNFVEFNRYRRNVAKAAATTQLLRRMMLRFAYPLNSFATDAALERANNTCSAY